GAVLMQAAVEALPLASGCVDLVTATLTYRHWSDRAAGLAQIRRVLTADGVLCIATVNAPPAHTTPRFWRRGNATTVASAMASAGLAIGETTTLLVTAAVPQISIMIARPVLRHH